MSCTVVVDVLFAHGMAILFDGCICSSRLLVLYPLDIFARMTISVARILNSDALANCHRNGIMVANDEGIAEKRKEVAGNDD